MSETKIYEAIEEIDKRRSDPLSRGLVECRHGSDVQFHGRVISAHRPRKPLPFESRSADDPHEPAPLNPQLRVSEGEPDAVLHRITTMTVGKPLWEYTDLGSSRRRCTW
ncbi:hypothetical protein BD413DRAFT_274616 [Trametes elegans]|nr:hypothetical protein BD413DRAFT_274495 [Trametes elegans]KAI0759457.1 hypothetical protein BD413DRAFT_274616 [Trametes elegans]